MLTGTPLDLTPFGPLLSVLGFAYWILALGLVTLALWWPRRWPVKLGAAALVVGAFAVPMLRQAERRDVRHDAAQSRLAEGMALFAERCKTAGETISRTVDDVDGVVWMKWREKVSNADNFADQWKLNDPYGQDCGAEDCIANLLRVTAGAALNPERAKQHSVGYGFVESVDPNDGLRYRYAAQLAHGWTQNQVDRHTAETGKGVPAFSHHLKLEKDPIEKFSARYGIVWDDISTREDREHWIAGGSLKIIDRQTNEVIAQRIGYMIDRGQGSQAGGRSPWALARESACPAFRSAADGRAYFDPVSAQFARRVLQPSTFKE